MVFFNKMATIILGLIIMVRIHEVKGTTIVFNERQVYGYDGSTYSTFTTTSLPSLSSLSGSTQYTVGGWFKLTTTPTSAKSKFIFHGTMANTLDVGVNEVSMKSSLKPIFRLIQAKVYNTGAQLQLRLEVGTTTAFPRQVHSHVVVRHSE